MYIGNGQIFVMAGEWMVTDQPLELRTTLGSCVALVAWHPEIKVAGMCHFLLPSVSNKKDQKSVGFYGESVLDLLCGELNMCAPFSEFRYWLAGGGAMLHSQGSIKLGLFSKEQDVGKKNIALAHAWLESKGLKLVNQYVGGSQCRTIGLDVSTGAFSVKEYDALEGDFDH